jgi:hypothetical protein
MTAQISRPPTPKMTLGDYYGDESLKTEFKEFCLKICPSTEFSNDEIFYFLESGKMNIDLSRFVLKNLKYYVKVYLARYMSCFMNGKINGELYFGINDYGEVTGIPSTIEIDYNVIEKIVDRNLFDYVKSDDEITSAMVNVMIDKGIFDHLSPVVLQKLHTTPHLALVELIKKHITFNVAKPTIDLDVIEESDLLEKVTCYKQNIARFKKDMTNFTQIKTKWLHNLHRYRSLNLIINSKIMKSEFRNYLYEIRESGEYDTTKMIERLDYSEFIPVPDHFILTPMQNDKSEIFHWLMLFKEMMMANLASQKPRKPIWSTKYDIRLLLSKISNITPYFAKDPNVKFKVVCLYINGANLQEDIEEIDIDEIDILFKNHSTGKWGMRVRTDDNGIPGCI